MRITVADCAKRLGISARAVYLMKDRGLIELGQDGTVDWEAVLEARKPRAGTGEGKDRGAAAALLKAKAEREATEAARAALKLQAERGELLPVDRVRSDVFEAFRGLRDAVLGVPARVGAHLAVETDAEACARLVDQELRQALETAAQFMRRLGTQEQPSVPESPPQEPPSAPVVPEKRGRGRPKKPPAPKAGSRKGKKVAA